MLAAVLPAPGAALTQLHPQNSAALPVEYMGSGAFAWCRSAWLNLAKVMQRMGALPDIAIHAVTYDQ